MKYQQKNKTAFCFLVSNEMRDFYLLLPFIYYLERYENFTVRFEFVWDAHKIRKAQPDLVIVPNSRGQLLYFEIAKYCFDNGILVFNHDSEGNFNTDINYDYWAYNREKKNYCPILFTYNQKVKDLIKAKYQINEKTIVISGAPGFDKYSYVPQINRFDILHKYHKTNYKHVVGYAGWAFGKIHNPEINDVLSTIDKPGEAGLKWLKAQRDQVEECLKAAIENHPEILFILKKHPRENFESDLRDSPNEMNSLLNYSNVLYLKDEEEIQDLIQISDLWMAFESTSIMEAWLLKKPTLMINPDPDFKRVNLHKGSVSVKNKNEMLHAFNEFFHLKNSLFFDPENIIKSRDQILEDAIGFSDGLNHLRCVKAMKPYLDAIQKRSFLPKINYRFLRLYYLLHIGKYIYIPLLFKNFPKLKKTVWIFENYELHKVKEAKQNNYVFLDKFYSEKGIDTKIKTGEIWTKF